MSDLANFAIMSQPTPDVLSAIDLPPNTPEYTYLASAINIALSMLETPQARNILTELALLYDATGQGDVIHFGGNRDRARRAVDQFLGKMRASFPLVVVYHPMGNLDMLGYHIRAQWVGTLNDFDPRKQTIHINGQRVHDMVASASSGGRPFRDFQFLFATTFFHEAGPHLLITYLDNDRPVTPEDIGGDLGYSGDYEGESGRWFELHIYGGTLEWYKGSSQNMRHTGIPHLLDRQLVARRIDPRVIIDVTSYRFSFPFSRTGNPVHSSRMQSMGRPSVGPPANNSQRMMMAQQSILVRRLGRPAGHRVRIRDVRAVVNDPRIRLLAY